MEPARTIIDKLGGPTRIARAIGIHRARVGYWAVPSSKGGTNGVIPHKHVAKLLELAREQGVPLSTLDFAPVVEQQENGA